MSVHSSFSEDNHLRQFRDEMKKIKSPFLQKIKASAQTFQIKMKDFKQKMNSSSNDDSEEYQEKKMQSVYHQKQLDTEQNMNEKENEQATPTAQQLQMEKMQKNKKIELPLDLMKQWAGNSKYSFNTMEEVKENFINVFSKKLGVNKKKKTQKCYDFKDDEKNMIFNLFHELQNQYGPDKGFVGIDRIIEFFQQNQLFYLFYNIHPNQIKYILKDSARTKPQSLTKKEFLYVFIMDRPLLKDLSDPFEKVVHRQCILDSEGWQQLKTIFNTLDTFGNETIHIRPFIQKLKNCHSNPNLIYTPVIEFPQIERVYTLKKIVFDLEHKFKFEDKIQWKDIEDLIYNFNHKEEPTIDIIFERHLEEATILLDSNYFLIEKKIIALLKHLFQKCPKFSDFFVNTKFLCNQLIQNHDLKMFYRSPIREKTHIYGGYLTLEETIRSMNAKAPQYIDLDEFLEFFSIKGPVTNVLLEINDSNETSEEEEEAHDERTKMLRKIRSLQKLEASRKNKKPKRPIRNLTDFAEFNLAKKEKQTIRQKKVKEMVKEKQEKQEKQLKKQFKANPIPADLNPERIKEEQKKMQMRRRKKLQQRSLRQQQDKQLMSYLRANTRLFEPLNKKIDQKLENQAVLNNIPVHHFTHKPVPWFVQEQMLDKIEREKSERKNQLYEEAKLKYVRSWNKLPDFFFKNQEKSDSESNSLVDELEKRNQNRRNAMIKANPVPDFKSLHKEFEEQLQKKKQSFEPTKIQGFRLTSPKQDKRQMHSEYVSPQRKNNSRWRETLHSPPANRISTTKKTQEWMEHNKMIQEEKRFAQEEERQKEKQRISKQKNFAKFMSKKLREQQKQMPNLEAQTTKKLNKHKKTVQYFQKLTQRQLSEMYARVLQRPFLFEVGSEHKENRKPGKKGDKKKLAKKGVIKHIEPIDMSEETTNKYRESNEGQQGDNYGVHGHDERGYTGSGHQGLNQSF